MGQLRRRCPSGQRSTPTGEVSVKESDSIKYFIMLLFHSLCHNAHFPVLVPWMQYSSYTLTCCMWKQGSFCSQRRYQDHREMGPASCSRVHSNTVQYEEASAPVESDPHPWSVTFSCLLPHWCQACHALCLLSPLLSALCICSPAGGNPSLQPKHTPSCFFPPSSSGINTWVTRSRPFPVLFQHTPRNIHNQLLIIMVMPVLVMSTTACIM